MSQRRLSVLVPVCNGEKYLPDFFTALAHQTLQPDEIIIADSESDDASFQICKEYGARVLPIRRDDFDHGGTRNLLAAEATGELLVYFTQDAVLAGEKSLQLLVKALEQSEDIVCAYGRQLPAAGANLQASLLRSFNYPECSEVRSYLDRQRLGLKTAFISNSFAAYKKKRLLAGGGFQHGLVFGEDTCTLGKLLAVGYKVAYCAEATVYHSHNYSLVEEFRRAFDIGVLHGRERWLVDTYGRATAVGGSYVYFLLRRIIKQHQYHLIVDWLLRNGIKFAGYSLGKRHAFLPRRLCQSCSMHSRWWKRIEMKNPNVRKQGRS